MAFSYIGGKSRIGIWIKDYIPYDIETYIESFGGAFWVFFKLDIDKYKNLKKVIYNDYNKLNSNLFACIKNYDKFYQYIKNVKSQNEELFYEYQKHSFNSDFIFDSKNPNYQLGLEYIYVVTQVFSGSKPEKSKFINLKGKYKSKFDTFKDKLINPKWQKLFSKIDIIENLDFEKAILKYDNEKTFHYIDAPYYNTEHFYSKHNFKKEDHERLSKILNNIKGKFAMSYYYFDKLNNWYPDNKYKWESKNFKKSSSAQNGKKQNNSTELLIMNY
jgi:DNA adenine methylase